MTRNNSAINLPSVRIHPPEQRSILQQPKERISHSPGIHVTQVNREKNSSINNELKQKESIYVNSSGNPVFEKLKIITNVVSGPNNTTKSRNDRSIDNSNNISGMDSGQASVLQRP